MGCTKFSSFFTAFAVLIIKCLTICSAMNVLNITTDESSLLAFKSYVISDPANIISQNWSTTTSICNWIGVSCGLIHHRVIALNLSDMGLQCTIAPHLGNLTFLKSLDFSYNNFTGFIPDELVRLRRLEYMDLSYNNLVGEIPPWLGSFQELQHLILKNNNFTGSIPGSLGNISKLETLIMNFNFLQGDIPPEIGNLSMITTLQLRYNQLTGPIPPSFFNISSLESIDLTGNSLSGSLPMDMCGHPSALNGLFISANQISGEIPSNLYRCRNLQRLSMSFNRFNGSMREFGKLSMLQELYIGENIFEGEIPMEIGNLTQLELLSIQGGSLSGKIPSFLFNMSSLRIIDLGNNSLSGSLPMNVDYSQSVVEDLYLQSNHLTGQISSNFWDCKRLQLVNLYDNKLTGGISRKVGNLTMLKDLSLYGNRLTGELPAEIGNLNLERLNVRDNGLSGPIPSNIFNISTLKVIDLGRNNFSGRLPSSLDIVLLNLEVIYLSDNKLSGPIPNFVSNASKLTTLDMNSNSFSGPIPTTLGNLRLLERLLIAENNLTGETSTPELRFVTSLTNCKHLEMVEASLNQFNGILPASIGNLSSSLQLFKVFGSKIRGAIPSEIGNLTGLRGLYLDSNELTGNIPSALGNLESLERIYLEYNKLGGYIPPELCKLTNLGDIYVSNNKLNGTIPKCLGDSKSLKRVYLDSNRLTSLIPSNIWSLNDLVGLNLSSNLLSGSLPVEIGNLKVVTELGLSWNQFSGDIPSSIGSAESLVYLSLAHNKFHGVIPETLEKLISLETLDLSNNNLSGNIPKSLDTLRYLKYFNVSSNNLEGEIPSGGRFSNFTAQSFMHNDGLCGVPRLRFPRCKTKTLENSRSRSISSLMKYIIPPLIFVIILLIVFLWVRRRKRFVKPVQDPSLPVSWEEFSYQELVQATDAFSESNLLGTGGFGTVYRGILCSGLNVAVKVFHSQLGEGNKSFRAECEVLRNVRHRNLVKIISSCSNTNFRALVLEYMPNGSLENWLYSHNYFLSMLQRLEIAIDVSSALEYLHHDYSTPIIHCDIKPSNILLDEDMVAHVSDFGISKLFAEGESIVQTRTLGTIGYMAPEYGTEGIVSTSADVYSFGVILLEIFTRKKPTDEMFGDKRNLRSWVSSSLQNDDSILNVVDTNLFEEDDENGSVKKQSVLLIFRLAMDCLNDRPQERINMRNIVVRLKKIKILFQANLLASKIK